jgi:hypothetical protein
MKIYDKLCWDICPSTKGIAFSYQAIYPKLISYWMFAKVWQKLYMSRNTNIRIICLEDKIIQMHLVARSLKLSTIGKDKLVIYAAQIEL